MTLPVSLTHCFCVLRTIKQNVDVDQNNSHSKLSGLKNDENPRPSTSLHPSPTQASVALSRCPCYSNWAKMIFVIS
jgi:hypothetical protein